MSHQAAGSYRREDGTASVELIGVVPFLLLAVLVAAQIGVAGYALWSAGDRGAGGRAGGARRPGPGERQRGRPCPAACARAPR